MPTIPNDLREQLQAAGQDHVFQTWDTLTEEEQATLLQSLESVDTAWLKARWAQFQYEKQETASSPELSPTSIIGLPTNDAERAIEDEARRCGEDALRNGKVAAFLVAGGQGTRLGYDGPKGCYSIGPLSDKTLFLWHAEQIRARARKYGATIPWYIMTSPTNDAATRAYFEENDYLGFAKEDIMIFPQAVVPSMDFDGKLMLSDPCHLAVNPDGHGGALSALHRSGALADMNRRGITTISYFQVDNPLVTICDPVFVGYHLGAHADMSCKVLEKAYPEEKVGIVCRLNGRQAVVEYSDLDDTNMYAKDTNGRLLYWAGSIAIHMLSVHFVEQIGATAQLPWHIAKKKIPYYANGSEQKPEDPNGIKFEQFVFDALPFTSASITMEVARENEFAPVKNPDGIDSAESCRQLLSNYFGRWLDEAGHTVPRNENGDVTIPIEISPLFALDAEECKAKLPTEFAITDKIILTDN